VVSDAAHALRLDDRRLRRRRYRRDHRRRSPDRRLIRTARERTIERLRDHFIICGYGRVAGDVIVGVGTTEELQRLEHLFARRQTVVD
jgi:hypothetical protein